MASYDDSAEACAPQRIAVVDLFCGVGGLSRGLESAGLYVAAGIDLDGACRYPFERNITAPFVEMDVSEVTAAHLRPLWPASHRRMLAGCAPCQPFSPYRRGADTSAEAEWELLGSFGDLVSEVKPDFVTMENVTRIGNVQIFKDFVAGLVRDGYHVDYRNCHGPRYGLPQQRRRLVLLASLLGPIEVPRGNPDPVDFPTVREAIGHLPELAAGQADSEDSLHSARSLSAKNLQRIQASKPGGTWRDWDEELRSPCHQRATGASFQSVYARMEWDKPAPTITTLAHNYGAGRFGHPVQDRPISLREAAILQGFPEDFDFVPKGMKANFQTLGRLIGNAVPPPLGRAVGEAVSEHVRQHELQDLRNTGGAFP